MVFRENSFHGLSRKIATNSGKIGALTLGLCASLALLGATGFDGADAQSKKNQRKLIKQLTETVNLVRKADDASWRTIDPENMILMDLPSGEVVIELRPDLAPVTTRRIRQLAREGFYDGLRFHRVIQGFVAQGGDPKGDGTGGSEKPDIIAEFTRESDKISNFHSIGRDRIAAQVGYVQGMPVAAQPKSLGSFLADGEVNLWGIHCPGTLSMARATNPNSGNSQFFFVIGDARQSLDSRYTAWGWVVHGFRHSKRIARGEPPTRPTPIVRMRVAADLPESERPDIKVFDTNSPDFQTYLEGIGKVKDGLVRDMCDIKVPTKVDGEVEL